MTAIFRAAAVATALFATAAGVRADAAITTTLTFQSIAPIHSGFVAFRDAVGGGGGTENSFSVGAGFGSTTLFPRDTALGQIVVLGVSDAVAQGARLAAVEAPHLVVGLADSYAAQDFAAAFGAFDETAIVSALNTLTEGLPGEDERVVAAYATVDAFAASLLNGNRGFGANAGFQLTGFSVGVPFGTGQSLSTGAPAVPEPATWAMLIGGVGMTGGALRRRRILFVRTARA